MQKDQSFAGKKTTTTHVLRSFKHYTVKHVSRVKAGSHIKIGQLKESSDVLLVFRRYVTATYLNSNV